MEIKEDLVKELIVKNEILQAELDSYRDKSPLVGVRWYGAGGTTIHLDKPIRGYKQVVLDEYGAKGVIDYNAWQRVENSESVVFGVLVRDDTVIDELGVVGKVALPSKDKNPNAFTEKQLEEIVKGPIRQFKKVVDGATFHFPLSRIIKVIERLEISDTKKSQYAKDRFKYLMTKLSYSLLHEHDLTLACEMNNLPFEHLTKEQMVEALTKFDLQVNK